MLIGYGNKPTYFLLILTGYILPFNLEQYPAYYLFRERQHTFGWDDFVLPMGASSFKALMSDSCIESCIRTFMNNPIKKSLSGWSP